MFPKIGVPQNGWFIVENPIEMDDLEVTLFLETPIYVYDFTMIYYLIQVLGLYSGTMLTPRRSRIAPCATSGQRPVRHLKR